MVAFLTTRESPPSPKQNVPRVVFREKNNVRRRRKPKNSRAANENDSKTTVFPQSEKIAAGRRKTSAKRFAKENSEETPAKAEKRSRRCQTMTRNDSFFSKRKTLRQTSKDVGRLLFPRRKRILTGKKPKNTWVNANLFRNSLHHRGCVGLV